MSNLFCHLQLNTADQPRAKTFYSELFDWSLDDTPMPDGGSYTMIQTGSAEAGGGIRATEGAGPTQWLPYVLVEDVSGHTERARQLGAQVVQEATEIPGMGSFSIVADPTGAVIGLWQAA